MPIRFIWEKPASDAFNANSLALLTRRYLAQKSLLSLSAAAINQITPVDVQDSARSYFGHLAREYRHLQKHAALQQAADIEDNENVAPDLRAGTSRAELEELEMRNKARVKKTRARNRKGKAAARRKVALAGTSVATLEEASWWREGMGVDLVADLMTSEESGDDDKYKSNDHQWKGEGWKAYMAYLDERHLHAKHQTVKSNRRGPSRKQRIPIIPSPTTYPPRGFPAAGVKLEWVVSESSGVEGADAEQSLVMRRAKTFFDELGLAGDFGELEG